MYHLDAAGKPTLEKDKDAIPKHDFTGKLVKDPVLEARLGRIASAIGGKKYVSARTLAASSTDNGLPDPILGGGTEGRVLDSDGNGKPDFAVMRDTFSRAVLIDADEDSLGSLKPGDAADDLVKAKKLDAEVSVIVQNNIVWAMYDTDADNKFDLALMTTNGTDASSLTATHGWRIAKDGTATPALDQIGRKLLRPGLVSLPRAERALRFLSSDVATDEGMGSLPDPYATKARFRTHEVKGAPTAAVIEALDTSSTSATSTMLFDVDHDTKLPKAKKGTGNIADFNELVKDGKYDAEVALVHHDGADSGTDWTFYDTDADGKFDLVLFLSTPGSDPAQAYRFKDGKLTVDESALAGKAFRTKSVFKSRKVATEWKTIADKLFMASSIEE